MVIKKKEKHKKVSEPSITKKNFETFEFGVIRLKEIKKELDSLDTKKFEKEENEIREKLKNVSEIPAIEKLFKKLKLKIKHKPIKKVSKKKEVKKILVKKEKILKKISPKKLDKKKSKKINQKNISTLLLKKESEIAMDFAIKVYKKFNKMIKSVVLFGSTIKQTSVAGSDIDIIIILDDVSVKWDQELIAWYRGKLDEILRGNPYQKSIHINTIKLSTWWEDLIRGDPVIINILRYGEAMIDFAGFFEPLKFLLVKGKIKSTPESIYNCLQRAPIHLMRSKTAELNSIEGLYWAMVDSSHAALIAADIPPASPEHIPVDLKENFVNTGKLKMKYVLWYRDLLILHKKIAHKEITDLKGVEIDDWQEKTEEFLKVMAQLVKELIT
jgi:predicted nucleotidyltransferase